MNSIYLRQIITIAAAIAAAAFSVALSIGAIG
jgi:hypothetical protein